MAKRQATTKKTTKKTAAKTQQQDTLTVDEVRSFEVSYKGTTYTARLYPHRIYRIVEDDESTAPFSGTRCTIQRALAKELQR